MILCTHCGHQNRNESAFCTFCGNRLSEDRFVVGRLILLNEKEKREYLIADADRRIGRDTSNDIVVDDDEISACHARIFFEEGKFWVEDLQSTNGTFLNGKRICRPTGLHDDDLLKMGRTLLKFKM